jgi:hypothetical protein
MIILPPSDSNKPGRPADCWSARLVGTTPTDGVKPADPRANLSAALMRHSRPSPGPDMQVVAGLGLGILGVLSAEHGRGWLERGHELFCETLARSFLARPAAGWLAQPAAGWGSGDTAMLVFRVPPP